MALFQRRFDGAVAATVHGILDRFRDAAPPLPVHAEDRLDGRTCLEARAEGALGEAAAVGERAAADLLQRGAGPLLA